MVFGKKAEYMPNIKLNGITLHKVEFTKFLGVLIHYHLYWNNHIELVQTNVANFFLFLKNFIARHLYIFFILTNIIYIYILNSEKLLTNTHAII